MIYGYLHIPDSHFYNNFSQGFIYAQQSFSGTAWVFPRFSISWRCWANGKMGIFSFPSSHVGNFIHNFSTIPYLTKILKHKNPVLEFLTQNLKPIFNWVSLPPNWVSLQSPTVQRCESQPLWTVIFWSSTYLSVTQNDTTSHAKNWWTLDTAVPLPFRDFL